MNVEIKVPSVGESIRDGVLGAWLKKEGEFVRAEEPVVEFETDKVTVEVPAPASGALRRGAHGGTKVEVGQVIGMIDTAVAAPPAVGAVGGGPAKAAAAPAGTVVSPAVRRAAAEAGVDPRALAGTGKGGRLTKSDVMAAAGRLRPAGGAPEATEAREAGKPAAPETAPEAAEAGGGKAPVPSPPVASLAPRSGAAGSRTTRRPMSPMRRRIADRLVAAQAEAAILTTFNEADMSAVMGLRAKFQERFQAAHGIKLGFMAFFVRAVVEALKAVPSLNARIDGEEIVENHYYDIGVAISTERGLVVPVIRDADRLDLAGIERAISEYAARARAGRITLEDLEGGVFTITNGGVFGSLLSTPILNPPQSGILGMHTIQERPVAVSGRVEIRPMMYLALSYDHRLVDGRDAVAFLVRVKEFVEQPGALLLGCG